MVLYPNHCIDFYPNRCIDFGYTQRFYILRYIVIGLVRIVLCNYICNGIIGRGYISVSLLLEYNFWVHVDLSVYLLEWVGIGGDAE